MDTQFQRTLHLNGHSISLGGWNGHSCPLASYHCPLSPTVGVSPSSHLPWRCGPECPDHRQHETHQHKASVLHLIQLVSVVRLHTQGQSEHV